MNCSACGHTFLNEEIAGKGKVKCSECGNVIKKKGKPNPWVMFLSWIAAGAGIGLVLSSAAVLTQLDLLFRIFGISNDGMGGGFFYIYFTPMSTILGAIAGGVIKGSYLIWKGMQNK